MQGEDSPQGSCVRHQVWGPCSKCAGAMICTSQILVWEGFRHLPLPVLGTKTAADGRGAAGPNIKQEVVLVKQVASMAQNTLKEGSSRQLPGWGRPARELRASQVQSSQMLCSQRHGPRLREGPFPEPMAWARADRTHRVSAEP